MRLSVVVCVFYRICESGHVDEFVAWMRSMPMLVRWGVLGVICAGVAGGIVGLIIGLFTYAPTAPFAVVELGLPAAMTGGIVGLVAGLITITARRIRWYGARHNP